MSSALAVAAVTATLRDLLNNGLIDQAGAAGAVGDVEVTTLPPDRVWSGATKKNRLNIFLYHVSPNPGWRNQGLPSWDRNGDRLTNPPLALDLHYMLTAYGVEDLVAEVLLGYGMQLLHERPVLTRPAIEAALGGGGVALDSTAQGLPVGGGLLRASDLTDQVETIKLTPHVYSVDEVFKLWGGFQTSYRPSAYYQASVVLIESRRATRSAPPVLERAVTAVSFLHPTIDSLEPLVVPFANPKLTLVGAGLRGGEPFVGDLPASVDVAASSETRVALNLPGGLRAGPNQVRVVRRAAFPDGTTRLSERSNSAPFLLAPRIVDATVGEGNVTVRFEPAAAPLQRVALLLGQNALVSPPRSAEVAEIVFPVAGLAAGPYPARIEIDGAQSPPVEVDL